MTYTHENILDMTYDEYTYEVDMMLVAEFGEPATHEQLFDIASAWDKCIPPHEVFAGVADSRYGDYDDFEVAA